MKLEHHRISIDTHRKMLRARAHQVHRDPADVVLTPGAAWTLKGTTIRGTGNHHPLNVLPQLLAGVPQNDIADQFIDGWRRRIQADEKA